MTKGKKTVLSIAAVILTLIAGVGIYCNRHMDRYLTDRINHAFDDNDSITVSVGDVKVLLMAREAFIDDLYVLRKGQSKEAPALKLHIDRARIHEVDYLSILRDTIQHFGSLETKGIHLETTDASGRMSTHIKDADLEINDVRYATYSLLSVRSVFAEMKYMHVYTDQRTPSPTPVPMPQDLLRSIPLVIHIDTIGATIGKMDCAIRLTDNNEGTISLSRLHATLTKLSNKVGRKFQARMTGRLGDGKMTVASTFTINRACDWTMDIRMNEGDFSSLDSFLHPVMAFTTQGKIHSLKANYKGGRNSASGEFCMMYEGLALHTDKQVHSAFDIIDKLGKLVDSFVATFVPKRNPAKEGKQPTQYYVQATRDEYRPVATYITAPIVDGIKKTFFPGLNLKSRIREDKTKKETK